MDKIVLIILILFCISMLTTTISGLYMIEYKKFISKLIFVLSITILFLLCCFMVAYQPEEKITNDICVKIMED